MAKPQTAPIDAPRKTAAFPFLLSGVFLVVGLGLLSGAIYTVLETRHDLAVGTTVDGTVTDLIAGPDSDGDTVYYPHVRFVTRAGDAIEFTGSTGSSPAAFEVGETVSVLYDPSAPGHARINSFFQLWLLSLILGGLGSIFTTIGAAALAVRARSAVTVRSFPRRSHSPEGTTDGVVQRTSRD